jgi:hypothetical protein
MNAIRRKFAVAALIMFGVSAVASVARADEKPTRTYALVVANNGSVDDGVEPLRFADDDGARFYEMFDALADDATLLTTLDADSQKVFTGLAAKTREPSRANLKSAVEGLRSRLEADRSRGVHTEVYLVFTGHGNVDDTGEGYLSLADGKLTRSDLYRDVIRPLNADYTHLIVDACHAYFMVRSRGGNQEWKDDRSGQTLDDELKAFVAKGERSAPLQRVGVILSTSGTAEVHEWSRYRGGVFSHQLRSGLLGAADADADGAVSYREIEAYLVAANASVSNPKARIRVFAEPPAQDRAKPVLRVADYGATSVLEIPQGVGGRYHVEDDRGLRYADMNVATAGSAKLALVGAERRYFLRTDDAQAEIPRGEAVVKSPALAFAKTERQSRGSVEEAFRTSLFATPYGPSFVAGFAAGRDATVSETASGSPADADRADKPWRLSAEIGLGTSIDVVDGHGAPQLQMSVSGGWTGPLGIELGLYGNYGFSSDTVATVQRVGGGVELLWLAELGDVRVGPRARFGPQAVFVDADFGVAGDERRADPLGLRSEGAVVLGYALGNLELHAVAGVGLDLVTTAQADAANQENLYLSPFLGTGVSF